MKPLNQKEINEKFFNFMILFIICVAVFSFALYFNTSMPGKQGEYFRKKADSYEKLFSRYQERYDIAAKKKTELDNIRQSGRGLKFGEADAKAREIGRIYIPMEDSDNAKLRIFEICQDLLLADISNIDSLSKLKQEKAQLRKALDDKIKEFEDFRQKTINADMLRKMGGNGE